MMSVRVFGSAYATEDIMSTTLCVQSSSSGGKKSTLSDLSHLLPDKRFSLSSSDIISPLTLAKTVQSVRRGVFSAR